MATVAQNVSGDLKDLYTGYDQADVGLGLTGTYANAQYAKKKTEKLLLGSLSELMYIGFEVDPQPLAIPFQLESSINCVMCYNLNYLPVNLRQKIIKYILDGNQARIKSQQPLIVDYYGLKAAVPESQYIVRRYKVQGTRVLASIPLRDWDKAIRVPSKFENHWRLYAQNGG